VLDSIRERLCVAGGNYPSGLFGPDQLERPAAVRHHDRQTAGHRFRDHEAESILERRHHEDLSAPISWHRIPRRAGHLKAVALALKEPPAIAVAGRSYHLESHFARSQHPDRLEQMHEALAQIETADEAQAQRSLRRPRAGRRESREIDRLIEDIYLLGAHAPLYHRSLRPVRRHANAIRE
jgi:hypothetical protein